jgi:hypothetical protein
MKRVVLFLLVLFLMVGPALAAESQPSAETPVPQTKHTPSAGAMLFDGLVLRPVGIVAMAVGLVGTVIVLPFSIPSGSVNEVGRKLIGEPFNFTFTRPLGDLPDSALLD